MWGHLLIYISTVVSVYIIYKKYHSRYRDYKIALIGSGLLLLMSQIVNALNIDHIQYAESILLTSANALLLTGFLILVRILKPEFMRYPYITVYFPLIMPLSYFLVLDSPIIQTIITASMHTAALSVFIILSIGYWGRLRFAPQLPMVSITFLLFSFIQYWILESHYRFDELLWQLFFSMGMIFGIYSFSGILRAKELDSGQQHSEV